MDPTGPSGDEIAHRGVVRPKPGTEGSVHDLLPSMPAFSPLSEGLGNRPIPALTSRGVPATIVPIPQPGRPGTSRTSAPRPPTEVPPGVAVGGRRCRSTPLP